MNEQVGRKSNEQVDEQTNGTDMETSTADFLQYAGNVQFNTKSSFNWALDLNFTTYYKKRWQDADVFSLI